MTSRNLMINAGFILFSVFIFFLFAKLLLFCAGLCFSVEEQTRSIATGVFLVGGLLCALLVIYKN